MEQQQQWPTKLQQSGSSDVDEKDTIMNCNNTTDNLIHILDNKSRNDEDKCDRNVRLQQKWENEISEKSRTKIQAILSEVNNLSPIEKLLLYLKLPTDSKESIDPLRQPLNPLGSRSEIHQTITWIQTHLEEDPEISLQKKGVYEEYKSFCGQNRIKNLSTADFGKVMKQVYPKVRPRRLGTRGNSQYCYSGLRKRVKLSSPLLPDLGDKPQSTESASSTSDLMAAVWIIVKEWSEVLLGSKFESFIALAYHLITKSSIGIGTKYADLISESIEKQTKVDATSSNNKHKEMTLQLQRKIQQKSEIKEQKRKIQSPRCDLKSRKKCRMPQQQISSLTSSPTTAATSTTTTTTNLDNNNENNSSPSQGLQSVCDKSLDFTKLQTLPDFSSFQKPVHDMGNSCDVQVVKDDSGFGNVGTEDMQSQTQHQHQKTSKVAIPRLPTKQSPVPSSKRGRNAKYKAIQPKPEPCDIAYNPQVTTNIQSAGDNGSQDDNSIKSVKQMKEEDIYIETPLIVDQQSMILCRERLISVSKVSKDALDGYLGTENSQEHEEEIMKYFENNESQAPTDQDTQKLSQLRQLLEQSQNFTQLQQPEAQAPDKVNVNFIKQNYVPKMDAHYNIYTVNNNNNNVKRRVSFDTTQVHDEPVPPSPNTRRKHFNFTPISPGPHSPNGRQSKCSSTNASPFVSPRNTPVPRARVNNLYNMNQSQIITTRKRHQLKSLRVKPDVELGLTGTAISAPPSPKTNVLQDLLTNKISYNTSSSSSSSDYPQTQIQNTNSLSTEVSLLLANNINNNNTSAIETYRSQSVPIRAIPYPYNYDSNSNNQNDTITTTAATANTFIDMSVSKFIDPIVGDNNNTQLHDGTIIDNRDDYDEQYHQTQQQQQHQQQHYFNKQQQRWPNRSQSFDYDIACIPNTSKCPQSCRSVPSTPIPHTQHTQIEQSDKIINSRSYPSTPLTNENLTYNFSHDYLLNGQPIKEKQQSSIELNHINYLHDTDDNKMIYSEIFHDNNEPSAHVDGLIDNKSYNFDGHIDDNFETKSINLDGNCDIIGSDYFKEVNGS